MILEISPLFRRAPAAKTMHHAYLGGLLEHVVSLCELCSVVAARYPETNRDLLLTGAVLHDIGKVYELSYDRSLGYTTEGQLVGHIVMAVEMIGRKAAAIPDFLTDLATLVKHMILSHHGHYEFGSPKLPMFREAVMLHYLDDLDSKMGAMRVMLASDRGEARLDRTRRRDRAPLASRGTIFGCGVPSAGDAGPRREMRRRRCQTCARRKERILMASPVRSIARIGTKAIAPGTGSTWNWIA